MFLVLFLCPFVLVAANPFHKYPYVFLLDVGNEELQKTNTEQIRITIPGGSLALRYPAVDTGETIAHVRVSGIDFGTDLKANIVDGGPGYKYVVVAFMGNQGVPYDAVMTIQTVSDSDINDVNESSEGNLSSSSSKDTKDDNNSAEVTDNETTNEETANTNSIDANDSSEDMSDDTESQKVGNSNTEVSQGSSNVYSYAKNEENENVDDDDDNKGDDGDDCDSDNLGNDNDIHSQYSETRQEMEVNDYQKYSDMNYEYNSDQDEPEQSVSSVFDDDENDDKPARAIGNNLYQSYAMIRPALYGGVRFYPQNAVPFMARDNSGSAFNQAAFDPAFEDENEHNQPEKFRDSNNNFLDSDDSSAIMS